MRSFIFFRQFRTQIAQKADVLRRVIDPTDPAPVIDHDHPLNVSFFVRAIVKPPAITGRASRQGIIVHTYCASPP